MSSNPIHSEQLSTTQSTSSQLADQIELEFMQTLLAVEPSTDAAAYPWNPFSPEADPYFAKLEQYATWEGWNGDELSRQANSLASHCSQLWAKQTLLAQFSDRMPADLLETIVRRAQETIAANALLVDRLVSCVQDILPTWADDDLYVLARPLAYAMRSDETPILAVIDAVRSTDWADLSEIEQARLSLALARYTLDQLDNE
jgi:hypothetical protein